jgi:hypothetical protein
MNFQLSLHETPPSLNRFTGGSRGPYHREKKKWQEQLGTALMVAKVPRKLSRVKASATVTFPVKRRRDEGNIRFLLEKALGDILVEGGWLPDDTPDAFTFGAVTVKIEKGKSLTTVDLEVEHGG